MTAQLAIASAIHLLAAIVWVGGMFFAHMALRPAANELLQPAQRLPLMLGVFERFFPWVWASVATLLASGFWIFFGVLMRKAGLYVHLMMGLGLIMSALFVFLWFFPFQRMRRAVGNGDLGQAAAQLARIRRVIATNLVLGILVSVLAASRWPIAMS